ncbi:MAG: hypothetical protein ABJ081_03555 [Hyphomicrobiales bacterium]
MKKWFKNICVAVAALVLPSTIATTTSVHAVEFGVGPAPVQQFQQLTNHQQFARQQLTATIKLYDDHLRVKATGQYLDKIDTNNIRQDSQVSSIASTGIGLISLTIGDQLGVIDNAAEKAHFTLINLLNTDPEAVFRTPRSKSGWYKHFINAHTGEARNASKDVFSTIDTAILGVGASMVARYFDTKVLNDPMAARAVALANELVESINWAQSIRFTPRAGMHQVFRGPDEMIENRFWSLPFDEYVVLPCIGRAVEVAQGRRGAASILWDQYFSDINALPQAQFGDLSLLSVNGKNFTSHFTHQFGFYFCGELANDPVYKAELNELRQADMKWFEQAGKGSFPKHWWGLGAGSEIKFDQETGKIRYSGYGVARIGRNPNLTFSPAIMAGFLPVENSTAPSNGTSGSSPLIPVKSEQGSRNGHSDIIADLIKLHNRDECRYDFAGLDFLWRCTARDTSLRVRHIEGVDLSTYMLGLAWFDPAVGKEFFDDFGVKSRPSYSEARELRTELFNR